MPILRRSDSIVTASGYVTLCKQPFSAPVESGQSPLSTGALRMSIVFFETCRGL